MIFKIKSKMKINLLVFIVLVFAIRTSNSEIKINEVQLRNSNSINLLANDIDNELDPSDLLPSGVDTEKLKFKTFTKHSIDQTETNQESNKNQENDQFINLLVKPNDKSSENNLKGNSDTKLALPFKSLDKEDNHQNQLPTLVLENFYSNDLTKKHKVNINFNDLKDQTYSNYFPESNPTGLINDFKQLMPKMEVDRLNHLSIKNVQAPKKIEPYNHETLKTINKLDSKINLNDVLDQVNILMGSNLGYIRVRQRRLIRKNPGILAALDKGLKLSLSECKYQFKDNYWNCPTNRKLRGREMFGKILNRACRETAYLTSIRSAGLAYAITKACSDGLIRTCSCDYRLNKNYFSDQPGRSLFNTNQDQYSLFSKDSNELGIKLGIDGIGGNAIQIDKVNQEYTSDFKWSGCSDNIKFAFEKTKQLLDWHLKSSSSSTQDKILVHNYNAGRKAVKENMYLVCKCHGMSGTCTMRTCWRRLSSFRKIGNYLKKRYDNAIQVVPTNDGESLIPKEENIIPPTSLDLFYSEQSPDFCDKNPQEGSLGTSGRQCNPDATDATSCDQLCCGRGYRKKMKVIKYNCNCQFQWCCDIKCDTCKKTVQVFECV